MFLPTNSLDADRLQIIVAPLRASFVDGGLADHKSSQISIPTEMLEVVVDVKMIFLDTRTKSFPIGIKVFKSLPEVNCLFHKIHDNLANMFWY